MQPGEQKTWQTDADELRRLQARMKYCRYLLVDMKAQELSESNQLDIMHVHYAARY